MKKLGVLLGVLIWASSAGWAEEIPTITAVMENGPSSNRINVVFLSEAYVASQRETYFNDVAIATEGLFNFTPFKEY
ncbi:MAG: M64 family metallopeptidase, partial [Patescibacteria group bacterium]